eukprot:TRINITY_DN27684_c0_g1_i1.p1 TRINITY_DN27684_c0_g1~~TRINITY_DN27684_c0_g1_i1.p1  ORF type:complete len:238 (-),score=55.00 TRINITY_DN27684_c0_g1_i1:54-767(-)
MFSAAKSCVRLSAVSSPSCRAVAATTRSKLLITSPLFARCRPFATRPYAELFAQPSADDDNPFNIGPPLNRALYRDFRHRHDDSRGEDASLRALGHQLQIINSQWPKLKKMSATSRTALAGDLFGVWVSFPHQGCDDIIDQHDAFVFNVFLQDSVDAGVNDEAKQRVATHWANASTSNSYMSMCVRFVQLLSQRRAGELDETTLTELDRRNLDLLWEFIFAVDLRLKSAKLFVTPWE